MIRMKNISYNMENILIKKLDFSLSLMEQTKKNTMKELKQKNLKKKKERKKS